MKKLQISFEEFEKHIKAIERADCLQIDINRVTQEHNKYSLDEVTLHLPNLADNVIDLLEILTQDEDEWISYYIYELDYGQDYREGATLDKNGDHIPLATIEDLWNVLTDAPKLIKQLEINDVWTDDDGESYEWNGKIWVLMEE